MRSEVDGYGNKVVTMRCGGSSNIFHSSMGKNFNSELGLLHWQVATRPLILTLLLKAMSHFHSYDWSRDFLL